MSGLVLAFKIPIPIIFALMLNVLPCQKYKKVIQTVTYILYFFSTVIMVSVVPVLILYPFLTGVIIGSVKG